MQAGEAGRSSPGAGWDREIAGLGVRLSSLIIALALLALALGLRLKGLAHWPFSGDESFTLVEVRSLLGREAHDPQSPIYRLPRFIPLGYWPIAAGIGILGENELGGRIAPALAGTIAVPIVFLALERTVSRPMALISAVLLAAWPTHIQQSQYIRFYAFAGLLSYLAVLAGSLAVERRTVELYAVACALVVLALFAHTLTVLMFPLITIGIALALWSQSRPLPPGLIRVAAGFTVLLAAIGLFYVRPMARGWNSGSDWGIGPATAVLNTLNQLGWPLALLALLGAAIALKERTAQGVYWLVCLAGCAAATLVLPLLVVYHGGYIFPFTLGVLAMAGYGVWRVLVLLRPLGWLVGAVWIGLAIGLQLPALAGYYADGSRVDLRAAAQFVRGHWRSGERVAVAWADNFTRYAPELQPLVPIGTHTRTLPDLQRLTADRSTRMWIVIPFDSRRGLDPALQAWLFANTVHVHQIQHFRVDFAQLTTQVFLFDPRYGPFLSAPSGR